MLLCVLMTVRAILQSLTLATSLQLAIMKRILFLSICLVLVLPITVNATGGGLRKNSIKTCPNGVTYGMHSDDHGGTHWHVAVTNGTNYYADGEAIYSDPCPGYNKNEGTAGATAGTLSGGYRVPFLHRSLP